MSPQLAAIYSEPLMALLAEGKAPVDRIAVCPWHTEAQILEAQSHRPLLLHNMPEPFALNHPDPFDKAVVTRAQELMSLVEPPWLSVTLGFNAEASEYEGKITRHSETQSQSQVYLNTCRSAARLRRWLTVPLLLANPDFHPGSGCEYICEPLFIIAVLDAVGCDFLLDIAHARISAHNMGLGEERYIRSLPLFRTQEIHVSGTRIRKGTMYDAHEPLQARDWDILSYVLSRAQPKMVTLEYAKDKARLQAQLERLRDML